MRRCLSAAGCAGEAARAVALAVASADEATLQAGEADAFERAAKRLLDAAASANAHSADEAAAAVAIAGARCRTAFAAAQDSERETLGLSSTMAAGSRLELTLSCAEELLAGIALRRLKHVRQSDRPSPSILPVPAFPTTIFSHCFSHPPPAAASSCRPGASVRGRHGTSPLRAAPRVPHPPGRRRGPLTTLHSRGQST